MLQTYAPSANSVFPMMQPALSARAAPPRVSAELGKRLIIRAGKTICAEGETADNCYKIVSGFVRTVKFTQDGRRQVCDFVMAGDLLGFDAQDYYTVTAEALTDCSVIQYPRRSLDSVLRQNPGMNAEIRAAMGRALAAIQERLVLLCKMPAKERFCWFLLHIADRGQAAAKFVDLPMARGDIADYLGLANETVSRVIADLKAGGIIATEGRRRVKFLDRNELEDIRGTVCA
jgi:CRP-like cAMP-binding protein